MPGVYDSAVIAHYADVVALLYRHARSIENLEKEEDGVEGDDDAELIIVKQPNGLRGHIPLTFLSKFTRFETRSVRHPHEQSPNTDIPEECLSVETPQI